MADCQRSSSHPRWSFEVAVLEVGGRATAGMMMENDLPEHWSAVIVSRRAKHAVLLAVVRVGADRD